MTPTFSVIVPTYNRARWLRAALESVLAQDYHDFECLVVDDAGTEPLDLPDDARIRVFRHAANAGIAAVLNNGLDHARGEYVTFLDDDDGYTSDRLSMTLPLLGRAPVVFCWSQPMGRPPPAPGDDGGLVLDGNVYDTILDRRAPPKGAAVIRRSMVPRFDKTYAVLEDLEWWLRATRSVDVATVPRVGYLVRLHGEVNDRDGRLERIRFGQVLLHERDDYFRVHRRAAAMRWFSMGLVAREVGDNRLARRAMFRSLRAYPVPKRLGHLALTMRPSTYRVDLTGLDAA
jgi:glycosyltransferase involved in cell wall biosynthesis